MSGKVFKVIWPFTKAQVDRYKELGCPRSIPLDMIAPCEPQAKTNHQQSLSELNRRGGLCPVELVAVLEGKGLRWIFHSQSATVDKCIKRLVKLLAEHNERTKSNE